MRYRASVILPVIFLTLISCGLKSVPDEQKEPKEISVLQFNIWHGGTSFEGAYDAVVDEIVRLDPDFVTFSEVKNEESNPFCEKIVASLKARHKTYFSFYSEDVGLLSRYPITGTMKIFPPEGVGGNATYKLITRIDQMEIAVYSAHLDYTHYAPYLPRGYDGYTWKKLPAPVTDVDSILTSNLASQRDEALTAFLKEAEKDRQAGRFVIIGGDFNEASHRDWTVALKDSFDHRGCVLPWTSTILLENAGFIDSFREKYPNPVTHPGFTYPADCRQVEVSKLAWAPEADDRDRIDFIFYYPHLGITLKDCAIVGPKGSIVRNQRVEETSQDVFIEPAGAWPTDHKAVFTIFSYD